MATKRKHNWPDLFDAFEQSGLTQTEFSQQHNINPKYFNRRLNQHRQTAHKPNRFSRVTVAPPSPASAADADAIVIEHGRCTIRYPSTSNVAAIAELVRLLA